MGKKTVSFLVSGRGSNFSAVAEKIVDNEISARLGALISDNSGARALSIAREYGMEAYFVDPGEYKTREAHEKEMVKILNVHKSDLVVAAGFMRLLTHFFVGKYRNRIINIHPALLPSFPGTDAQSQAFEYGVKITGCTTHFIDEGTDTGPVIMQAPVEVRDEDTVTSLSARILKEEHRILQESVRLFCENRIRVSGRRVYIK